MTIGLLASFSVFFCAPVGSANSAVMANGGLAPAEGQAAHASAIQSAAIPDDSVIVVGKCVGIKLFADGALVVGFTAVETAAGNKNPAVDAGIQKGDLIISVDGVKITDNAALQKLVNKSGGKPVKITTLRDGVSKTVSVVPELSQKDNLYKIGAWVRDSIAGIGTISFISQSGIYGALGHGICDVDTGSLMPVSHGAIMDADVVGVRKGINGKPGELQGEFDYYSEIGTLEKNAARGIFGHIKDLSGFNGFDRYPIADNHQIRQGPARIIANISGKSCEEYDVVIESILGDSDGRLKNMTVRITDKRLIDKTGGIVQGMSGSPIIQNGMFVGVLTHVLVNDPTAGYGIFARNMLEAAQETVGDAA